MNNGKVEFRGSIVAVVTPFKTSGEIDETLFSRNLELLFSEGAGGVLIAGSTGESWALERKEKISLFKLARSVLGKDATIIGGTGEIRTDFTVEASLGAKEAGMSAVLVTPPYFADCSREEVLAYFRRISDEAALPVVLYNHPDSTGINLDASYLEVLAGYEWIVATKESAGDFNQLLRLIIQFNDQIDVLTGYSSRHGAFGAMAGSRAFISSHEPQILGARGIALFEKGAKKDVDAALEIQRACIGLSRIGKIGSDPAGLKAAMNLLGRPGGHCRNPVHDLGASDIESVRAILHEEGLLK